MNNKKIQTTKLYTCKACFAPYLTQQKFLWISSDLYSHMSEVK